jgi:beta-galactosidase
LGEPTPFDQSRSSYSGIIDLAGFKKDRFYLYQAHWRPDYPMAHILPHWTWPERIGQITPVHVFTSGDEGELFLNGKSLGRRRALLNTVSAGMMFFISTAHSKSLPTKTAKNGPPLR